MAVSIDDILLIFTVYYLDDVGPCTS